MRARDVLGEGGLLSQLFDGYEVRESQLVMADAVERAIADQSLLLVEAGTGTGKTLAYLVPAILSGKRVVVSTGTKNLQDQLVERDVPLLRDRLGLDFSFAVMKGLGNYLCLRRYNEFLQSGASVASKPGKALRVLSQWAESTEFGDRAELKGLGEDVDIWSSVGSGPDTRVGSKCNYYDECFVTRMKRRAERAELIVVNHHLFFADIAARAEGGAVIPEHDVVIFDEAHRIEDIATEFFGVEVSSLRVQRLVSDAERAFASERLSDLVELHARGVLIRASELFERSVSAGAEGARVPISSAHFTGPMQEAYFHLDNSLEGLEVAATQNAHLNEAIAQVARRTRKIRTDLASIVEGSDRDKIRWQSSVNRRVVLGASPVDVSEQLRENLFFSERAVVMTSATLATSNSSSQQSRSGGGFRFLRERLGITHDCVEEILQSPFDYEKQACLFTPSVMPDPRSPDYLDTAMTQISELLQLTQGGALILCTSVRQMRDIHKRLRTLTKFPLLLQGEAPKQTLLDALRAARNAILVATMSFWEGVDVPGDALRLVVIDKLPFEVPTDPLVIARCERIKEAGGEPFMEYVVPTAALTLKQGFGRLIRTRSDRGVVAVLDARLRTKGYGKVLLRGLPPATRVETMEEVRAWWNTSADTGRF